MNKDSAKDRTKGKFNEAAGETREHIGRAIGNEQMEGDGHAQEMKGKLQGSVADVKDAAQNAREAAREAAERAS